MINLFFNNLKVNQCQNCIYGLDPVELNTNFSKKISQFNSLSVRIYIYSSNLTALSFYLTKRRPEIKEAIFLIEKVKSSDVKILNKITTRCNVFLVGSKISKSFKKNPKVKFIECEKFMKYCISKFI